jgi:hypothetical protein
MKYFIFILVFILPIALFSQLSSNCKPTVDVKVNICGHGTPADTICPECFDCRLRLIPADSNYTVISFVVTVDKGQDESELMEITGTGMFLDDIRIKRLLISLTKGSSLEIYCIKAKHKSGTFHVLNPIFTQY